MTGRGGAGEGRRGERSGEERGRVHGSVGKRPRSRSFSLSVSSTFLMFTQFSSFEKNQYIQKCPFQMSGVEVLW